ncbi:olfactory receptor 11A1-like [Antennarius striatus]|uniref:olfactory receptor 11A1-like n=1 Tax=Antennarius striatus TaxID=241820 RepID=UPI0035B07EC7
MLNSTQVSVIHLSAYLEMGPLRYVFFVLVLLFYGMVVGANMLLIVAIALERRLHAPMYLFLANLFVNELLGGTGLLPFLLLQLLSDSHTVALPLCFLQVFVVYSYVCAEFCNLAVMSYDRYLAICCPLQYRHRMTGRTVCGLVAFTWAYSFGAIGILIALAAPLRLCGDTINKVYCMNFSIVKLSCDDVRANNTYGLLLTFLTTLCPLALVLYTYLKILQVCFRGSQHMRQKALSTCTPHLASLLNFCLGVCLEILGSRFQVGSQEPLVQILLSVYFLTCQLLFTPLMYGLHLSKVRLVLRGLLLCSAVNTGP